MLKRHGVLKKSRTMPYIAALLNPSELIRFCFLLFLCSGVLFAKAQLQRFQAMQPKMGSPFHLVFYADDSATAAILTAKAFALVDSLNRVFSDYDPQSELSRLNRSAGTGLFVPLSAPLYDILKSSRNAWKQSGGAFDITMGPLTKLWRQSRKEGRFPADTLVQQALAKTGFAKVKWEDATRHVQLLQTGMQLDLGGIAKGYVAEAVVRFLQNNGIASALADAGGDIACTGAPPQKRGWTIGINVPEQQETLLPINIELSHGAVATSGDVYQFTEHEGKRYSHIINPKTGYGVTFQRNVTIIAPDGATADWLATACSILPVRKAKKLAKQCNAALLIGVLKGNNIHFYKTTSLSRYLRTAE
jgi:thiamine biosynthesis lipoprotein